MESPAPAALPRPCSAVVWLYPALLLLAGFLAYANTFSVPLLLDDIASIVDNPSIRRLWPMSEVLSPPSNVGLGGRPVANLTFALNHAAGRTDVRGYHLVNLAIHLGTALILLALVRRTLASPAAQPLVLGRDRDLVAFLVAAVWMLHPLQTESVTYISQRTESLMAFFYLATVYAFVRAAGTEDRRVVWSTLATVACALGMATKEVMVTAPVIVFLYDRTFVSASFAAAWRNHKRLHLALAATWLLLALLLSDIRDRGVGYISLTWWQYALAECRVILLYLKLAFVPYPLVFDYGTEATHALADVWPHALLLAIALVATLIALWRAPLLGFAAAWTFITLAPTSSIVPVAGQPMAEHRMYLPLVALVGATLLLLHRTLPLRIFAAIAAVIALASGWATFDRNRDYRDAITLWSDTAAKAPRNARAHAGLGAALYEKGDLAAALPALQRAVRLDPRLAEAHNNLAMALIDAGRSADAIAHFTAALEHRPGVASTHYNFGNALLQLGRTSEAIAQHQQALVLRPDFPEASAGLAAALAAAGRLADAVPHFETALRSRPDLAAASYGLANTFANLRRFADALPHYEATLRTAPDNAEVHFNYANALAQAGRLHDAIPHYEAALKLNPDFVPARTNLEIVRKAVAPR